jgi:hypothetical protein
MIYVEVTSGASYEANKKAAQNDNLPIGTRFGHGIDAVKDKGMLLASDLSCRIRIIFDCLYWFVLVEQNGHEAKKDAHMEAATDERGVIGQIGDTISNAYHYVAEKVSGMLM